MQADPSHFSSVACFWWAIDGISFSWKSSENFDCYDNHIVLKTFNGKMFLITITISVDWMFLKPPDRLDMDEILDMFKNWPDGNINLRVMPLDC